LLNWLPDETFFSWVSRNHRLWGHDADWRTSQLLFGSRQAGIHHDLPNGLGIFSERTANQLGTAEAIARERTLLRYYGRFLSPGDEQEAVLALSGNSVAHLKFRLGLLTSRFRAHHPLKACTACMAMDVQEHGWAYWHLQHQYPGVWWCNTHGIPLRESLLKSTGVDRFLWHLPCLDSLRELPSEISHPTEAMLTSLSSLAKTAIELVAGTRPCELEPDYLYRAYRAELTQRGWVTEGGSLRLSIIAANFLEYARQTRLIPELGAFPATIQESMAQIGRLLRPMRSGAHPLRHILIIDWLFGDADSLLRLYRALPRDLAPAADDTKSENACMNEGDKFAELSVKLIQLMKTEGKSARATAQQLGVDTATVMVWAAKCGIKVSRRPKILKEEIRALLIASLRGGMDKAEAAKTYGISIVTVTQVLRSEIGLHEAWKQCRQGHEREKARKGWRVLMAEHGNIGIKLLRSLNPAVYAWLYRNDRPWLQQNLPIRGVSNPSVGGARIDWDQRDIALSGAVEAAALAISSTNGRSAIQLWQLYQQVPELKAKLSVLDRLPLTQRVIERALNRRSAKSQADDLLT
jgi:transposase